MLDTFFGFGLICVGLYVFILTGSLQPPKWDYLGSSFIPRFAAIFLAILGVAIIIESKIFLKYNKKKKENRMNIIPTNIIQNKVFISIILLLIYSLTINFLGYIISTLLFSSLFILYLDDKNRIWIALILSIVFTSLVYYIFTEMVYVNLPSGIFF